MLCSHVHLLFESYSTAQWAAASACTAMHGRRTMLIGQDKSTNLPFSEATPPIPSTDRRQRMLRFGHIGTARLSFPVAVRHLVHIDGTSHLRLFFFRCGFCTPFVFACFSALRDQQFGLGCVLSAPRQCGSMPLRVRLDAIFAALLVTAS